LPFPGPRPERVRSERGAGLLNPSELGGLDELREFFPNRASNSPTRSSRSRLACIASASISSSRATLSHGSPNADTPPASQVTHATCLRRADHLNSYEGVLFSAAANADALLVTLHKSEADYSPTTMYQDYAISPELFHWESQSVTTVASKTGQRYLNHRSTGSHVLLFTRPQKVSALGAGAPYLFLGEADYAEHRGERPIAITWHLRTPSLTWVT
jgi:hypothetical protein